MKILVACESSGVVREAFRKKGHSAWSCDLLPADDGSKFHLQGNVLDYIDESWDIIIAHPPCTYLCGSGIHWLKERKKKTEQEQQKKRSELKKENLIQSLPKNFS